MTQISRYYVRFFIFIRIVVASSTGGSSKHGDAKKKNRFMLYYSCHLVQLTQDPPRAAFAKAHQRTAGLRKSHVADQTSIRPHRQEQEQMQEQVQEQVQEQHEHEQEAQPASATVYHHRHADASSDTHARR